MENFDEHNNQVKQLERSFINSLRESGFEISPTAVCRMGSRSIDLGIEATGKRKESGFKMGFASEITLYVFHEHPFDNQLNTINFGSSGEFDPLTNQESYWRITHAATLIKNWNVACQIINSHGKKFNELLKKLD